MHTCTHVHLHTCMHAPIHRHSNSPSRHRADQTPQHLHQSSLSSRGGAVSAGPSPSLSFPRGASSGRVGVASGRVSVALTQSLSLPSSHQSPSRDGGRGGGGGGGGGGRGGHIPYRNSMLTMVLKDSLGEEINMYSLSQQTARTNI